MQYKNITDRNRWIVCQSVKQLIPPGGIVTLSHTDIRHAGGAMRFFESVHKAQEIADDLFRRKSERLNKKTLPETITKANENKTDEFPIQPDHIVSEIAGGVVKDIMEGD